MRFGAQYELFTWEEMMSNGGLPRADRAIKLECKICGAEMDGELTFELHLLRHDLQGMYGEPLAALQERLLTAEANILALASKVGGRE